MKRMLSLLVLAALLFSLVPGALAEGEPNPIPVLSEEEIMPTPKGIHHYMMICVDSWAADLRKTGNHTDGLILVTVDEYARRVMLTSFIRDMLIANPHNKSGFGRINNIMDNAITEGRTGEQGIQELVSAINSHFGLRIEKFIVVDFRQVENIINAVGGVDITVTSREANYLKNYSISRSSTTPELGGAGTYHFSGHAAVIYMRIRKIETAAYLHADGSVHSDNQDYGRTYRDRVVLSSIADSLKDISYDEAMKLLDVIIQNTVYTNMSTDDMFSALDLAMDLKGTPIEHIRMPADGTHYEEFPYAGMATKQIDFLENRDMLQDFLFNQTFVVVDDE